jgi:hypothetical protein
MESWNFTPGCQSWCFDLQVQEGIFFGKQWDPVFGGLDCDIRPSYWEHMTIMLPSCLFWFASWHTYKVQPTQNYMKLPPDTNSIARDLLELYSSLLGPSDYEIHVASAAGMVAMWSQFWTTTLQFSRDSSSKQVHVDFVVILQTNRIEKYFHWIHFSTFIWFSFDARTSHTWASSITTLSCVHPHMLIFIAILNYEIQQQPQGTIGSAVMLLRNLQPTTQLFAPLLY